MLLAMRGAGRCAARQAMVRKLSRNQFHFNISLLSKIPEGFENFYPKEKGESESKGGAGGDAKKGDSKATGGKPSDNGNGKKSGGNNNNNNNNNENPFWRYAMLATGGVSLYFTVVVANYMLFSNEKCTSLFTSLK